MKKILLVDDAADIRRLLTATLDTCEFEMVEARDGEEAVSVCAAHRPDAAIIDIQMPGPVNGIEAVRRIKESPDTKGCHIVMLTGLDEDKYVEEALAAGAAAYLVKPFSPLELIGKIEQLLGMD